MTQRKQPASLSQEETRRGVFDIKFPGLGPVICAAVETRGIGSYVSGMLTAGSLWSLLYFHTPTRIQLLWGARRWQDVMPGSTFLMPPTCRYQVDTRPSCGAGHHVWIVLDGLHVTPILAMVQNPGGCAVYHDPHGVLAGKLTNVVDVAEAHKTDPFWPVQAQLTGLLDMLVSAISRPDGSREIATTAGAQKPDPLVGRVLEFMSRNLSSRIRLSDLARHLHASPSTVSHRYRAFTGEAPMQTLKRMRMLQAKLMLIRGQRVADIAEQLGFYDEHHFSLAFKAAQGVSPRAFLKHTRDNPPASPPRA